MKRWSLDARSERQSGHSLKVGGWREGVDLGYGAPVLVQRAVSEGWEGAARCLLARRTRTMKLCSSYTRRKGQPRPLRYRKIRRIGGPS